MAILHVVPPQFVPTVSVAAHLVFAASVPSLFWNIVLHLAGAAWTTQDKPHHEQDIDY